MFAYGSDYDDVLPLGDWNEAIAPYLNVSNSKLQCPSVQSGVGYGLNSSLVGIGIHSIQVPDTTPMLFDSEHLGADALGAYDSEKPKRHGGPAVVFLSGRTVPDAGSPEVPPAQARDQCLNNLKALATAITLYTSDNDDQLMPGAWVDALTPYLSGNQDRLRCPAVPVGQYGAMPSTSTS